MSDIAEAQSAGQLCDGPGVDNLQICMSSAAL